MNYDEMKNAIDQNERENFRKVGERVECEVCKRGFVLKKSWQRFCGTTCRNEFHRVNNLYGKVVKSENTNGSS